MKEYVSRFKNFVGASLVVLFWGVIFFPVGVLAAKREFCDENGTGIAKFLGFPTWYKYLHPTFTGDECRLVFDISTDIPKVLLAIFEIILRIGGLLAVAMIIYGGIQYIISQGEPDKTKGARSTIINAIIGLVISISAVAIVNLIGRNL